MLGSSLWGRLHSLPLLLVGELAQVPFRTKTSVSGWLPTPHRIFRDEVGRHYREPDRSKAGCQWNGSVGLK